MDPLLVSARRAATANPNLPFSIYTSVKEQRIVNVPISKPLLICVLEGYKEIGKKTESILTCQAGEFVFLSNHPDVAMRNIPTDREYSALIIEFEFSDFSCFPAQPSKKAVHCQGTIEPLLHNTLEQFVQWCAFAPEALWPLRRQEILQLLDYHGHQQVRTTAEPQGLTHKLHSIICEDLTKNWQASDFASLLAMSESTLRRKLKHEATSLQAIKDKARLTHGLHKIQSTHEPISHIAACCGYESPSRFINKFSKMFGLTPLALRRTGMHDSGE